MYILQRWSSELADAAEQSAQVCLNQPTPQSTRTQALQGTEHDYSWVEENQYVGDNGTDIENAIEEAVECWFHNDGCSSATAVTENQQRNVSPYERRNIYSI